MTGASRPSMRVGKRALAAFAAGSIAVPLSFGLMGGTAFAAAQGSSTPPAPTAIDGVCPPGQVPDSNFPDTQNDFFKDAINCLVAYGVTQGYPDGNYKPSLAVNREQMALFFFRVGKAAGMSWNTSDAGFKDINTASSQEAKDAINALANAKVIQGFTDGTYRPAVVVHRDAMAKFIANTVKVLGGPDLTTSTNDYYTDDAGNIFENFINGITDGKISNGVGSHLYGPGLPVQRDAMAGFISRSMEVLYEAGKLPSQFNANVSSVTVSPTSQQAGSPVTITVTPASGAPAISSVKVTGACVPDTTATTDADSSTAGFQAIVPTNSTATAGSCTLTVVTTFADGTTATNTVPLTITAPNSATVLPELTSASIVSTTTNNNNTPSDPTDDYSVVKVQYNFDEPVFNPAASNFHVYPYNYDGTTVTAAKGNVPTAGDEQTASSIASTSGSTVTAEYDFLNSTTTSAFISSLTVATVTPGAVVDSSGNSNPDGDAAIGSAATSTVGAAGVTAAPDLTGVGNFRQSTTTASTTLVDFTFDQNAFDAGTNTYELIPVNGIGAASVIDCAYLSGTGTKVITVACPDANAGTATALSASNIARGVVQPGTVEATSGGANPNPLEAADVSNNGNTITPDLVSVTFQPDATASGTAVDRIIYTFDQAVASPVAGCPQFQAYDVNGSAITNNGTCTVNSANPTQVAVDFADGLLAQANGATVNNGGVDAANANAYPNMPDEVGFTNTQNTQQTPGQTAGPDLTGVTLAQGGTFSNQYFATYTFDQKVTTLASLTAFHLYLADGTELDSSACAIVTDTNGANTNQVACTVYGAATNAQIGAATLGTVDHNAVAGAGGDNPEGAEFTSGGTGTRTA